MSRLIDNLEAGRPQVVVAYGTSLTAGGSWVQELETTLTERYPGLATVLNRGGSGQWSEWGVVNLQSLVISEKPDTVFLEFAINDSVARFNCPVGLAKANLETMLERLTTSLPHVEIFLMTMTPGDGYPAAHFSHRQNVAAYYEMVRAVARRRGCRLIDHHANWNILQAQDRQRFSSYVPDTVYPTAVGCARVVTPAILAALGLTGSGRRQVRE